MSYFDVRDKMKEITGKVLSSIELSRERDEFVMKFRDGTEAKFGVKGECCSRSWIEHLEAPNDVDGALLLFSQESAPITQDHAAHDEENGGKEIQVYNSRFITDRGDIVLEFRNSSNGYYGGNLTVIS
jgi:hypothetical protein